MVVIGIASYLVSQAIGLVAIIDSYYTARHTKVDYELKDYNRWYVYMLLILGSILGSTGGGLGYALNVKDNLIEAFSTATSSMYPTLVQGDRFLANKINYKTSDTKRGDIVVFVSPDNRRWNYVKRVVAVAGDTVEVKAGEVYVNGQKLERKSMGKSWFGLEGEKVEGEVFLERNGPAEYEIFLSKADPEDEDVVTEFPQTTIGDNYCFVLGDNRNRSRDSRAFGSVPLTSVKGRADYLYFPGKDWSRFGRLD
jgi:signal peptidase I